MSCDPAPARRARVLLWLSAALGTASAAALSLLGDGAAGALPGGAVAVVGDRVISEAEHARALEMLAADLRRPPRAADAERVLERLIDEELLVQHALASGLVSSHRGARDAVLRAMLELVVAEEAGRAGETGPEVEGGAQAAPAPPPEAPDTEADARARALRAYLDELRARARIELAPEAWPR